MAKSLTPRAANGPQDWKRMPGYLFDSPGATGNRPRFLYD